ncbi:hypothetical protein K227x_18230 [Rubripirellula lacrimiformis]|uniref:Uncharacterized protein n=1 Tax=Rubripirellula lacrimiformis TaxID=1930273 RepID=A0A517N8J3_9BACT|nr:hypothetical protein [Rubripirellula lacrimiformis]QDT03440.1 hypothetical protein K227x_18230 [Rubripirellula lacrimiformis]
MKAFYIHPDDARWLARWLRGNLCGCVIIASFLWLLSNDAPTHPIPSLGAISILPTTSVASSADTPPIVSRPIAKSPEGWRRTSNGWEHTSTWAPVARTLGEWIAEQQTREPQWVQRLLAELRQTPPLIFALCQITAIVAVVVLTENETAPTTESSAQSGRRAKNEPQH